MIKVTLKKNSRGLVTGFEVKGHASFAPRGEDIVCAAVSALTQTAVISLEKIADTDPEVEVADGYLSCRLPERGDVEKKEVSVILNSMILGLEETARSYPGYLKINYK